MGKGVGKIASKYARALLASVERDLGVGLKTQDGKTPTADGAPEKSPAQQIAEKLGNLADSFTNDRDLHNALLSPMFPEVQRISALKALSDLFELPTIVQNFLKLMFVRGRLSSLKEVAAAFSELADKSAAVVLVEVVTARPVFQDEQFQIASSLAKGIMGRLEFQWSVDPSILGGMLIKYSGSVLDGTVRSSLMRVEQSLLQ